MSYGNNGPWGIKPVCYLNGAPWTGQIRKYRIASGYASNLFLGDPVTPSVAANGTITIATAGHATAQCSILGSFQGVEYTNTLGVRVWQKYWATGTTTFGAKDAFAWVADDPNLIYDVQSTAGAGITEAMLLRNVDMAAAAGSTISGLSGWSLDVTTVGTDLTRQLKIIELVPVADESSNTFGTIYNNAFCIINNHYYRTGVLSV